MCIFYMYLLSVHMVSDLNFSGSNLPTAFKVLVRFATLIVAALCLLLLPVSDHWPILYSFAILGMEKNPRAPPNLLDIFLFLINIISTSY